MKTPVHITSRRLRAAEGYLELELPDLALAEMDLVQEPGPLAVPVMWMTAEALKAQGRFEEAIAPLRQVARALPMPISRPAWESLTECLRKSGRIAGADDVESTIQHLQEKSDSPDQASDSQPNFQISIPNCGRLEVQVNTGGNVLKISFEPQKPAPPDTPPAGDQPAE